MYKSLFKRIMDVFLALMVLISFSSFLLLVVLFLAYYNKGSVFFLQLRPGKNGKLFRLIKFKTMRDALDKEGNPLPDKDRITSIGAWVRKSSLDEFPQLLNVLKGDMSLIGPRPLLVHYLPIYSEFQKRRHEVKPGITGWAQVKGRNTISWTEKFNYDVYYVDNLSFSFDLKIIILTFAKVINREGIDVNSQNTMKPFIGN